MVRLAEDLFVRPLFYDALSGEFQPPTDPQRRSHTLARLAVATFTKGEEIESDAEQVTLLYKPSWAPIESTVACPIDLETGRTTLTLLSLEMPEREVNFIDASMGKLPRGLVLSTGHGAEIWLGVELGTELDGTRMLATRAAQVFFNAAVQIPQATQ